MLSCHDACISANQKQKSHLDVSIQIVFFPPGLATVATSVTHREWLYDVSSVSNTTVPLVTGDCLGIRLK